MAERRVLLGTGAVVVGLGAALLSGAGAAHADGTDDSSGKPQASSDSSPSSGKATGGSKRAAEAKSGTASPSSASAGRSSSRSSVDKTTPKPATPTTAKVDTGTADAADQAATPASATAAATTDVATTQAAAAQDVPVSVTVGTSRRAAEAAARQAQINQILASAGTLTASAAATPAPASGLLATAMLNLLSGLGIAPRTAAATTDPAAQVTSSAVLLPNGTNGVTGVLIGHSRLDLPGAFIGQTVAADWYFPTQADGTVAAQGVIWLQHGFGATNTFYSALAQDLAKQTNSIVVAPTLSSIPITFSGGCLTCQVTQVDAAALLGPDRATLLASATAAGFTGTALPERFVLAGHSAGGGFATAVADDYLEGADAQYDPTDLVGVVMFDGVSNGALDGSFATQVSTLAAANKPVYQIAAPAQSWNLFGATTNVLAATLPGQFVGVVLQGGSHVDSMLGVNPLLDLVLQLVTKPVPAGNTAAVYTLSDGWINDMYAGATPQDPKYGLYAASNQQIIMGPTAAVGLPAAEANQLSFGDYLVKGLIDTVGGLFGFHLPPAVNSGNNGLNPNTPVATVGNGVTGVRTGSAVLDIPAGTNGYAAPADWYFPTQADGTVQANGIIWLQHGFLGFKDWYGSMAQELAQQTNSIVVVPNIFWFDNPLCPGCYLGGSVMQQAVASMFEGSRSALNISANAAGFSGVLPEKFLLTGHSAGGNFATAVGALITQTDQVDNLLGVVMFDGVSRNPLFTDSLTALQNAGIPDYQIAAPPQSWNAYGVATELMQQFYGDQFYGVQIDNGSHTDVIQGNNLFAWLGEIASAIIVRPSPPGAKDAVRTFASGWINDIYAGKSPTDPLYGIYGNPNNGTYVPNQPIVMGEAGATTLPAPPPVDVTKYANGVPWYEQGSVKLPFAWGLVNTKAVYTLNPDGTVKVQNSGNYFGPNGPQSNITGSAVSVNPAFNTRLDVGFFGSTPSSAEPGNYWILDYDPNYKWVIVSDPTRFSGYILTRDQTIPATEYDDLVARARQLGVWGPITPTQQYPATVTV
ncbi:lipocalin family protein [Mycobacterium sp. DL592]|uniref:lipocalin family protein n=1 Tax=Mycobacterium sp. DL592 TaxID=2675524 RepID=UPI0014241C78|nr:lipocalin family protein [Mycobacterium sp. DL592]